MSNTDMVPSCGGVTGVHLLFVCTGNTCRSPMAAFLMQTKLSERGLPWKVSSAGLYAANGAPMTPAAKDAMIRRHVPIRDHKSQPVTLQLVSDVDIILAMTRTHANELRHMFPEASEKIHELSAFAAGHEGKSGQGYDIVDPFGGSDDVYELCADQLDRLLDGVVARLLQSKSDN